MATFIIPAAGDEDDEGGSGNGGRGGGRTPDGSNNSNLRRAGTGQRESSRMERGSLLYQRKRERDGQIALRLP